jgi:DNA-binding transcriptional LysR family regulator
MSQPAISKAIAGMERALGVPLLDRSSRGVEVTEYGRVLLRRGTAVLDELRQGVEEIRFLADPAQGEVRIGTTSPMTAIVSAVIDRLSVRYPRMGFQVEVAATTVLFRGLRDRSLDLAISRTLGLEAEPDLHAALLFDDPLVVMAGRHHPLLRRRRRSRMELAELRDEPWVLPPYGSFLGGFILEAFGRRGLAPPRPAVVSVSVQMKVGLLRTGRYLSILPSAMLRFAAQYPGLAALPVDLEETRRPIALVTLAGRSPAPAARIFAECAQEVARGVAAAR